MTLRVLHGQADGDTGPRTLAPGAPLSPGACPPELATHLRRGEALAWWGEKSRVQLSFAAMTLAAAAVALLLVTGFAPSFWQQPLAAMWKPLLALLSPTLLVLTREQLSRRALLVTNQAIIDIPRRGNVRRLGLARINRVRRDWVRGGLRLTGNQTAIHVPTALVEDAGHAVRSRARAHAGTSPSDPLRWLC